MGEQSTAPSEDLFRDLRSLQASAFPRRCAACGRVFVSLEEYLTATHPVPRGSGLRSSRDDDGTPLVEVFRNCPCGSTLMEFCAERRDLSELGEERRRRFQNLLDTLVSRGIPRETAQAELKKILRGEDSFLLSTPQERGPDSR